MRSGEVIVNHVASKRTQALEPGEDFAIPKTSVGVGFASQLGSTWIGTSDVRRNEGAVLITVSGVIFGWCRRSAQSWLARHVILKISRGQSQSQVRMDAISLADGWRQ